MDDHLDIFGQQPFFTINIQACFCFPVLEVSSRPIIINTLNSGLERICAAFPWLACGIINEGSGDGNSGFFKFKSLGNAPRLVVKDHCHDLSELTMEALRRAKFPMRMLDEVAIAPRKIFPDKEAGPTPVFLIQANFIDGGLLLTFLAQHNTMDMTGLGQFILLFSKACHQEEFTNDELSSGNLPRRDIVPLLDSSYTPSSDLGQYLVKPMPSSSIEVPPTAPKCSWAYFQFSPGSLANLKSLAAESLTSSSFVSMDDALTAFIWKSIARARLPRLHPSSESTIMRAVNMRQPLGIPETYPGPIQSNVKSTCSFFELVKQPLGIVALQLRSALELEKSDSGYRTRAIATILGRMPDKSGFSFGAMIDQSTDVIFSSWMKVDCHHLDFNLGLGNPEAVRKPNCNEVEGLTFALPKTAKGELAVAFCLRDEDTQRLKVDPEFVKHAEYIG
ncbi:hypothetical protein PENFLA_c027G10028 [Penicillium flavigenum]|uniref:Trichothecene 3-O-acetyltransferase-like N-terminal domain-containing protein n=1 Tax=Penicillium flavigenum TaxID=254877 RepID=A0A1V6SR98_9EURO|nr:hypothetical protein PENFLA_c027G10028 [Penicillium flavigenum]